MTTTAPTVFQHITYPFGVLDNTHTHDRVIQTHTINANEKNICYFIHPSNYFCDEILKDATGFITKSGHRADIYGWDDNLKKRQNLQEMKLIIPVYKGENEFFHLATELEVATVSVKGENRNMCYNCNKMIIKRRGGKKSKEFKSRFRCGECDLDIDRDLKGTGGYRTKKITY